MTRKPLSKPNTIYGVIEIDKLNDSIKNYNEEKHTDYYLHSLECVDNDGEQHIGIIHPLSDLYGRPAYAVQDDTDIRIFDEVTDYELYILYDFIPSVKKYDDITDTTKFTDFDYAVRVLDVYNKEYGTNYKLIRKLNYDPQTETYKYPTGITEQLNNDKDASTHVYCKDISNKYLRFFTVCDSEDTVNNLLFISKYSPETWRDEDDSTILSNITCCSRELCAQKAREQLDRIFEDMKARTQEAIADARKSGKIYIEQPDIGYWKIHDTDGYYAGITTDDWKIIRDFLSEMDRCCSESFLQEMIKFVNETICKECRQTCAQCRINDLLRAIYRRIPEDEK